MNVKAMFKAAFPKPNIPQKRYLIGLGLIIYGIAKGITYLTPSTEDDTLPDRIKDAVMLIVHNEYDEDGN